MLNVLGDGGTNFLVGVRIAGQKRIDNGSEILEINCRTYIVRP
jgi:hypothetical protein